MIKATIFYSGGLGGSSTVDGTSPSGFWQSALTIAVERHKQPLIAVIKDEDQDVITALLVTSPQVVGPLALDFPLQLVEATHCEFFTTTGKHFATLEEIYDDDED